MKPLPHLYEVQVAGGVDGYAKVSTAGIPDLQSAPPLDFDGPGNAWSPEHLFLAAVETCFLFTFRSVARASKLEFLSLELSGQGKVDRRDGATRFTEIVLRPRLRLSAAADKDRALRILEKSEQACLVSASLSTPVRLEPEVLVGTLNTAAG
jgi:peroxiredoxin-like protein